jgi:leukotriene-A4 hydrolase
MLTVADGVKSVFLDSAGLDVHKVDYQHKHEGCSIWTTVNFTVTTPNKNLGNAIEVLLPSAQPNASEFFVRLYYTTNSNSTAINWLSPEQTSGKVLPYLFTQCEDIACRSVAPMQDTPAIKITYESKVKVAKDFVVKMSANETLMEWVGDTHKVYHFKNEIKIASYVIAIAVGDLEYRSLGDRVGVVTEPSFMEACVSELENLQVMLDAAESYLTPYIWGNYTILVLPPSFPMGGMENILLTFASPTIITGDKSQVDVATHEIAHSWTGNDVTCENWSNMWLNEGFTVFEERKVSAKLHNVDFSKVASFLGNIAMV